MFKMHQWMQRCRMALAQGSRLKTGPSQTGQLPGRIKSELCDLSGLRIDLISRLLSLSRLYSGILHGSGASALESGKSEKEWTLE